MDIQIQNVSRAPELPSPLPLAYLNPESLQGVDSGMAATIAGQGIGLRTGEQIQQAVQPLANATMGIAEYESPQAQALRRQAIAQANLGTTTATQQNQAATATPTLPLAERNLALAQTTGQTQLVAPQVGLTLANIGSEEQQLPSKTLAAVAGNTLQQQAATNKVNTTPNVPVPGADVTEPEMVSQAVSQQNALKAAEQQRAVEIAGNPFLSAGTNGGLQIPEGKYISGGKLVEDTVVQRAITGADGKIYNQNVWSHTGLPVSYLDDKLGARNATITNMQQRFGAMNGVTTPDAPQVYQAVASAKGTDLVDPSTGQPAMIPPALVQSARKIAQQFTAQPDVQMILKATPNINNAINNFQNSMTAQTGVESVEALNEAGRAFRGAVPTNEELSMLLNTAGLPAKADNLIRNIWNGDPIAPEQKQDYMTALNQLKVANDNYIGAKYNTYVKSLDTRMQPYADQLFPSAQQFVNPASQANAKTTPSSVDTSGYAKPQTQADYASLTSGTKYVDPNGVVGTKP